MKASAAVILMLAFTVASCSESVPTSSGATPMSKISRKWKGTVVGSGELGTDACPGFAFDVDANYTGNLSHFGNSSMTTSHCATPTSATVAAVVGTGTIIAANGDAVFVSYSGDATTTSASPFTADLSGTFTVTGGTGRFDDATGSGTFTGLQEGGVNTTNTLTVSLDGMIKY
jgi:hypothetical protein